MEKLLKLDLEAKVELMLNDTPVLSQHASFSPALNYYASKKLRREMAEHVWEHNLPLQPARTDVGTTALEVVRLVHKVELEREVRCQLVHYPLQPKVVGEEPRPELDSQRDCGHVADRCLTQARVLDLDRDGAARGALDGAMNLRERRGGDGRRLKLEEELVHGPAVLLLDYSAYLVRWRRGVVLEQARERARVWPRHNIVELRQVLSELDIHATVGDAQRLELQSTALVQLFPSRRDASLVGVAQSNRRELLTKLHRVLARLPRLGRGLRQIGCTTRLCLGACALGAASESLKTEVLLDKRADLFGFALVGSP